MKKNKFLIALPILVMFTLYYHPGKTQSPVKSNVNGAKKAIAASNHIYFQAFVKNDPSIFINRYADDCMIMPPNMEPLHGATGAREFFKIAYYKFNLRDGKFITTAVYGDGENFVTEEGRWQSFDAHHTLIDNGKFLVLWKKTPKGWKMFRDSFSSNRSKN
jgi:ketosteroid isomerase-like protein